MAVRTTTDSPIAAATLAAFVGRTREIAEVEDLLARRRLVTLTGPGGTGKTRLAIELASRLPEDAITVEMSPLSDPALVRTAVAAAAGLDDDGSDEALLARLSGRRVLIVLDNCEHLLDACAHLAVGILRTCPDVRVLATSRRPLGTAAETTYRVPPLSLPSEGLPLEDSEAVQLFLERAGRARPGFELSDGNAAAVVAICNRLDGLPLGLELAAARLRAFGVEEIERQLRDHLGFLASNDPSSPPRQRTLRALLDWSFDLLTERQQLLFRRLGIFVGGTTLDAIVEVCSDPHLPAEEVPGVVADLVDHSLLLPEQADGHTRLRLLDTIMEHARGHLGGEEQRWLADRHLDRSVRWAEQVRADRFTSDQAADMRRLSAELPNMRRALDHASQHDPVAGLRLASALEILWLVGGHITEGRERLGALLETAEDVPPHVWRSALRVMGRLCLVGGDPEAAETRLSAALELARRAGDRREIAELLQLLGQVLEALGRTDGSRAVAREALVVLRHEVAESGIDDDTANRLRWTLGTLGDATRDSGDPDQAQALYEEALELAMDHPDRHDEAMFRCSLAALAIDRGDPALARALVGRALDIQAELRDRNCMARSHEILARTEQLQGLEGWRQHLRRALDLRVEIQQPSEAARVLEKLARYLSDDDPDAAGALRRTAGRIRASPDDPRHLQAALRLVRSDDDDDDGPDPPNPPPATATGRFLREGQMWLVEFEDEAVRLRDTKGMRYLSVLLARPWHDVHVLELTSTPTAPRPTGTEGLAITRGGDAGELLDDQARRAYRRHIQELEDDIDEAERFHDDERASRAREERDRLIHELAAAFGLGGRPRTAADPSERARKAVYNRIRAAIGTIAAEHPRLGDHLERAVHTGSFCSYCPELPMVWET